MRPDCSAMRLKCSAVWLNSIAMRHQSNALFNLG